MDEGVEKITQNLFKYMKNTKAEKNMEKEINRLLTNGDLSKEEITDKLFEIFEREVPEDVKNQIYREINEMF